MRFFQDLFSSLSFCLSVSMLHSTAIFIPALFQIASAMTTCTRAGGRVWRSPPRDAGSGVTSMTGPRATTRGPAATARPTTGAARPVRSRRRKVGEKFVNRQFAWCLLQIGLLTKLDTLNNNNICHQRMNIGSQELSRETLSLE